MAQKKSSSLGEAKSSYLVDLEAKLGGSSLVSPEYIDSSLLWMATVSTLRRSASLSLGTTKSGTSYVLTIWDGSFPLKRYLEGEEEVNRALALVVRAYCGNKVPEDWEPLLREHEL